MDATHPSTISIPRFGKLGNGKNVPRIQNIRDSKQEYITY